MKKTRSIHAGLIAAVLLASISTSAFAEWKWHDPEHWAPYDNGFEYFFKCTLGQRCHGSKWR